MDEAKELDRWGTTAVMGWKETVDVCEVVYKVHRPSYEETVKAIEALPQDEFDALADEFRDCPGPHFSDNVLVAMSYLTRP